MCASCACIASGKQCVQCNIPDWACPADDESVEEQLREMITGEPLLALTNLHPELFEEVGGVLPWRQLRKALQHVQ